MFLFFFSNYVNFDCDNQYIYDHLNAKLLFKVIVSHSFHLQPIAM